MGKRRGASSAFAAAAGKSSSKIEIVAQKRKDRRKEERRNKKRQKLGAPHTPEHQSSNKAASSPQTTNHDTNKNNTSSSIGSKKKSSVLNHSSDNNKHNEPNQRSKEREKSVASTKAKNMSASSSSSSYAKLDPALVAQLKQDDEEIEALEAKLGLASGKGRSRLNKEYGKEGYGEDFGDFLAGLDSIVDRLSSSSSSLPKSSKTIRQKQQLVEDKDEGDFGDDDDSEPSIFEGEEEGDDYDDVEVEEDYDDEDDDTDEEVVPMKSPSYGFEEEDDESSTMEERRAVGDDDDARSNSTNDDDDDDDDEADVDESSQSGDNVDDNTTSSNSGSDSEDEDKDHGKAHIYRPIKGQDIYGNALEASTTEKTERKYVPPHMRSDIKSSAAASSVKSVHLQEIERSLNHTLNRLSEDTLVPTSQTLAKLYSSFPMSDVNDCLWRNAQSVCVTSAMTLMTALIPVYVAALAGVHILQGDSAQLGEYLIEQVVVTLWKELEETRDEEEAGTALSADENSGGSNKALGNLVLILCYLYNYDIVHCSLMYGIVRHLIEKYQEIDVELLLIILSHCGRALRSDDPTALKEIVLSVQKRGLVDPNTIRSSTATAQEHNNKKVSFSSRVDYMISAMTDLKNNKRRKQDIAYAEKTAKLRKLLGQIKSGIAASTGGAGRASNSSLRISLQDILNAETKGRWWKVGASWIGNQFSYQDGKTEHDADRSKNPSTGGAAALVSEADEKLLKLAAKYRMNSDMRRSIFCIIMGSADCDDAFEKLVRGGMLKSRNEKETVRVLLECCGGEKSYNKFYSHLASRVCDFQPQCKFSFQLAFWDVFKQFSTLKIRKSANLAKLLFHLVVVHRLLKLNVLKTIDMSSPSDLPETALVFLTIFFSSLLNHFDDSAAVAELFHSALSRKKPRVDVSDEADELERMSESEALQANLMVFFMQVLKSSPDYKKGSKFRTNLKVAIKACDVDNFF